MIELTSAQRRYLKQLSHHLKPLMQMGKEGPSDQFLAQLTEQIGVHELIKIRVLNNCEFTKEEIAEGLAKADVTFVQKVGHVYTVFKQKPKDSQLQLPKA